MKIKTTQVKLNAFSLSGYCLPTFQNARLKTVKISIFKTVKYLMFTHYLKGEEIKSIIRVK
mgnify:CR=1 FL=1